MLDEVIEIVFVVMAQVSVTVIVKELEAVASPFELAMVPVIVIV